MPVAGGTAADATRRARPTNSVWRSGALLLLLTMGCASAPPAPPPPPSALPPAAEASAAGASAKLVWLPVDGVTHEALADAVNLRLEAARLPGVRAHQRGPISMQVAQLSLECSQRTDECYAAVGRHLQANRLMWVELARTSRRKKSVTVAVFVFDVDRAAMVNRTKRTFASADRAISGLDELLGSMFSEPTPGTTVSARPVSAPP